MRQALDGSRRKTVRAGAQGAVLVEFAIVLPLLVLLFIITIDLGLVAREHQILQNAAREGARFSALPRNWIDPRNPGASLNTIQQCVIQYMQQEGIKILATNITVNQKYPIGVGSNTVYGSEVVVRYQRSLLVPGVPLLPTGQIQLSGRAVFRNLY